MVIPLTCQEAEEQYPHSHETLSPCLSNLEGFSFQMETWTFGEPVSPFLSAQLLAQPRRVQLVQAVRCFDMIFTSLDAFHNLSNSTQVQGWCAFESSFDCSKYSLQRGVQAVQGSDILVLVPPGAAVLIKAVTESDAEWHDTNNRPDNFHFTLSKDSLGNDLRPVRLRWWYCGIWW